MTAEVTLGIARGELALSREANRILRDTNHALDTYIKELENELADMRPAGEATSPGWHAETVTEDDREQTARTFAAQSMALDARRAATDQIVFDAATIPETGE